MKSLRGEGVTRIALRKYTSFGVHLAVKHVGVRLSISEPVLAIHPNINRFSVHLAVKHFGARLGMHPNIDRFSIRTGVPVVWNGRVCWCSRRLSFSSCCFQKGVSVTIFGRESRPTVGFERRITQYKCFGDERPVRES